MNKPFAVLTKILFLLALLNVGLSFPNQQKQPEMIADVVMSYDKPTAVTAFLCWKSSTKANLSFHLGNLKRPVTIRFINNRMKLLEFSPQGLFIVADLNCPFVKDFLQEANSKKLFNIPHRWLMIGNPLIINNVIVPNELKFSNIAFNSEVIVARNCAQDAFEMYLVYKVHVKRLDWHTEYFGRWTATSGLKKSKDMEIPTPLRRKNLEKVPIAVSYNVDDKEIGYDLKNCDSKIQNSRHSVTRWGSQQILLLYEFINATRVTVFTDDWGYLVNGTWNGVIGNMARGEVDLAGSSIFMSKQRAEVANYLTNPIQTNVKFVFREPPLSYQNNLFLLPFHRAVWYSLVGFVAILTLVIYLNALWESKKLEFLDRKNNDNTLNSNNKFILSDVGLTIVGAIAQQGCFIKLKGSMGRFLIFILFLAFLFLFTAYSASIVALLQSSSKQIRTLSDLLNSRLELGVENNAYNIHYFTTATEPIRKAIYETKIAPRGSKPNFMSLEEGVKKLQKQPFAFNMDVGVGYRIVETYFYEHEKCGLQEISYLPKQKPWLTCRKDSPYAELFKIVLYRFREHGMGHRSNNLVYSKKPVCLIKGGSFDSVRLIDVYPPLLMLIYGMILAFTLLLAEILIHFRKVKKTAGEETVDISINSSI